MKRIEAITHRRLVHILFAVSLPLLILSLFYLRPALARDNTLTKSSLPSAVNVCFTSLGAITNYSSSNSLAVQQAIDAASPGSVVKIAGTCTGTQVRSGLTQTAYISKALTLIGSYSPANWSTSNPLLYQTILDANNIGRVIYATATITVMNMNLQNGVTPPFIGGGGIYAKQTVIVSNTKILSNTAQGDGGGVEATTLVFKGVTLRNNSSGSYGGGAVADSSAWIINSRFQDNVAASGGGLFSYGPVTTTNVVFFDNLANTGGGGLYAPTMQLTGGLFLNNLSLTNGGDGITLVPFCVCSNRIVNVVFIHDGALTGNSLIRLLGVVSNTTEIIHATIAGSQLSGQPAIQIYTGSVHIINTIVASYSTGIQQFSGSVRADYDLFFGNGSNTSGSVSLGTHNQSGDPHFLLPPYPFYNYHLTSGSAAINHGTNAGVYFDNDGTSRPQAGLFDIGAYEWVFPFSIDLPVALKNY